VWAGSLGRGLDCRAKEPNRTSKPSQNELETGSAIQAIAPPARRLTDPTQLGGSVSSPGTGPSGREALERIRLPSQRTDQNGQTKPERARNLLGNPGYRTPCPPASRPNPRPPDGKRAGSLGRSLDCRAKEPNRTGKPSQNEPKTGSAIQAIAPPARRLTDPTQLGGSVSSREALGEV